MAERAATCLLAARLWRSRAIRFCARAVSVTCPLALDLAVVVLEVRANDPLDRTKLERMKTKSRRRSFMKSLPPEYPGKFFVALVSADQPVESSARNMRVKPKCGNQNPYRDGK